MTQTQLLGPPQAPTRSERGVAASETAPNRRSVVRGILVAACLAFSVVMFYRAAIDTPASDGNTASAELRLASAESNKTSAIAHRPIQSIDVGDRVVGRNPLREQVETWTPDPRSWRRVDLRMRKESGRWLWISLIRPGEWIEAYEARVGHAVEMDLPELGAVGPAEVLKIGPCPSIKPGDERHPIVTGTFRHEVDPSSEVVDLRFADHPLPTGVTANHPYWSLDRDAFIPAGKLHIGEQIDSLAGPVSVASIETRPHSGYVYNLETTEHVYRVADAGMLVHNNCALTRYADDGGHHIFAKRAFEGVAGYNSGDALAISQHELSRIGLKHLGSNSLTTTQ